MLKSLACFLLLSLVVSATDGNQYHETICENQLPDKCSLKKIRSNISPITNSLIKNESLLQCKDGLVLQMTKASISNSDKTKCAINGLINEKTPCSDIIMTTILTEKLCNGKTECELTVEKYYSSFCECSTQKYLDVSYKCVKSNEAKNIVKNIQKRSIRVNYALEGPEVSGTNLSHKKKPKIRRNSKKRNNQSQRRNNLEFETVHNVSEIKDSGSDTDKPLKWVDQIRFNLVKTESPESEKATEDKKYPSDSQENELKVNDSKYPTGSQESELKAKTEQNTSDSQVKSLRNSRKKGYKNKRRRNYKGPNNKQYRKNRKSRKNRKNTDYNDNKMNYHKKFYMNNKEDYKEDNSYKNDKYGDKYGKKSGYADKYEEYGKSRAHRCGYFTYAACF